ncbi:MAG: aryl-sulfate sulfotransferase [Myxococcota bacterium]
MLLVACGSGEAPPEAAPPDAPSDAERARLQALGYVDASREPADAGLAGVVVHDAARVQPGYRLFSADTACEADLIDVDGALVRRWNGAPCSKWSHAQLLEDGSLLVAGEHRFDPADPKPSYLRRYAFDGRLVRHWPIHAHHDAAPLPDGSLLALVLQEFRDPEVFAGGVVVDNPILPISPQGRSGRPVSLHETMKALDGACPFRTPVESNPGKAEPLHMNSIQWIPGPRPQVLISTRHQDCIYRIDWETKRVVWAWGRGELDGPHDATRLANGNVLVFDNGMVRGWSRVLEVEPGSGRIVWEYPGEGDPPFYTRGRGGSQRLPNGNTLIAESNEGRAFEVTRDGEIVWEYYNPRFIDGHRAAIIRMRHYPAAMIEPLLAGG